MTFKPTIQVLSREAGPTNGVLCAFASLREIMMFGFPAKRAL